MPELENSTTPKTRDTSTEERVVGLVLRIGAYASIGLIIIGGALWLAISPTLGHDVTEAGVLVLMSTPITRVLTAGLVFWREGDRRYALVSLGVFVVLILTSLMAAFRILPAPEH